MRPDLSGGATLRDDLHTTQAMTQCPTTLATYKMDLYIGCVISQSSAAVVLQESDILKDVNVC